MKYLLFILIILTACAKEPVDQRMAQLSVNGDGIYLITYGTSNQVTVAGEDTWSTTLLVNQGDTIQLSVRTADTPATLYMGIETQEGKLFCKSLYIEPQSVGKLNHILKP